MGKIGVNPCRSVALWHFLPEGSDLTRKLLPFPQ
jgi:hypothetical protein